MQDINAWKEQKAKAEKEVTKLFSHRRALQREHRVRNRPRFVLPGGPPSSPGAQDGNEAFHI